ncbi:hypothetical protein A3862_05225 [Methylobacterium sp. XJLW]|uniref:hypothetical protein n=1 Tax=Methylobacterium sp. XJLW TaxID=739141 RepID=UPI000DAAFEE0|nr:hypothetical protein [Methylobacterium sp. XJLW]AWV14984.1 hypothetical protein A3862_05225 [Methylobacterium sp. XJLW]
MEIKLTVDIPEFSQQGESYVTRRFAPALQEVADYLGASARQRLMVETTRRFSDPVAWTINAFAYRRAGTPDSPGSYVYVLERQARYLGLEVTGGPRVGGDYATNAGGPLVPASGARGDLDPQGNLPRDFVRDAVAAGARWAKLKPGQPEALVLPGRGPLQVLAVVARKVDYQPRFPFQDIVRDAVLEKAPAAVAKYLA